MSHIFQLFHSSDMQKLNFLTYLKYRQIFSREIFFDRRNCQSQVIEYFFAREI